MDWLEVLRQKQHRLAELKEELATLEVELRDAKAILSGRPDVATKPKSRHGFTNGRRARPIQHGSSVWWAEKVLDNLGENLPIDELLSMIEAQSGQRVKKNTLVSNLSRYVKFNDTFTRPAPSVFGLVKFADKDKKADSQHEHVA